MFYQEVLPPIKLADTIRYFWILEDTTPQPSIFRVLADGYPGLIFTYQSPFKEYSKSNTKTEVPQCFLFGVLQHYKDMETTGNYGILGISFFSHRFHSLFNIPMNEFTNNSIEIEDIFGFHGRELLDQLQHAKNNEQRIAILSQFVSAQIQGCDLTDDLLTEGVKWVHHTKGIGKIQELSSRLGISVRHLERVFQEKVGLSPKAYSRIIRFQQALRIPQKSSVSNLTDLAFYCGYSDQSHFIREFKAFAGFSPKVFFIEAQEVAENFVHIS